MVHRLLCNHLELHQKYSVARRNFNSFSAFGYLEKALSLVFEIFLHMPVVVVYPKEKILYFFLFSLSLSLLFLTLSGPCYRLKQKPSDKRQTFCFYD